MTDDYELMPHEAVEKLKREVEQLRQKAAPISPEIMDSIEDLTKSVNNIKTLFEQAAEDIKKEEAAEEEIIGKLDPIQERVNEIEDENVKIAQAILAIADMIKENIPETVVLPEIKKPVPTFRQSPPVKPEISKPHLSEARPPMAPPIPQPEISKPPEPLGPPIRAQMPPPPGLPPKPLGMPSPPGISPVPMPPGPMPFPPPTQKKAFFAKLLGK